MATGFLYFVPGVNSPVKLADLPEHGLVYAFERQCTSNGVTRGPDGGPGMILADDQRVAKIGYHKADQTWRRVPQTKAWVGYSTDAPPEPGILQRVSMLLGHRVTLGDGRDWQIPVARGLTDEGDGLRWYQALPQATGVDDETGEWVRGGLLPAHKALWDVALRYWESLAGATPDDQGSRSFDFAKANDAALAALASNYVVGKAEVIALSLFTDQTVARILQSLVDWPTLVEWTEKKTDEGSGVDG